VYDPHIFLQAVHRILFAREIIPCTTHTFFCKPYTELFLPLKINTLASKRIRPGSMTYIRGTPYLYIPSKLFEILHCRSFTAFRTTTGWILIKGLACMAFIQSKSRWPSAPCFYLTLSSRT
jgi:hypothetical protein